ncbi:MAG: DNA polymerase III subunit gamma/tau [Actinomycetes bacterium]
MSSPSLYRRHRPRTFSDVVGQEAVVRTLRNAIDRDAIHHAYLFVGSRGTGKTSMAKILAAALNCENGPTTEPCGVCTACEAIANSTSLDVIEMDAASNNSVDDIRDLRERVALAPVSGTHKVYILDEAHMLSSQAWNAFLKTLEEPPPNTVFVLATTEARKILPTVADRCHRFDFQRPSTLEVGEVVSRVAAAEGISAGPEVLALVSRSADGSFRDALGTLEQLVTYAGEGGEVSLQDALAVLGVVDSELRFAAVDAICDGDPAAAVRTAAEIASSGRDVRQFLEDLEAHARALLLIDLAGEVPPELSITEESDRRLAAQSKRLGRAGAVRLLDLVAEAFGAIRDGADPRLRLELLLVKAAERSPSGGPGAVRPDPAPARAPERTAPPTPAAAPAGPAPGGEPPVSAVAATGPKGVQAAAAALRVVDDEQPAPEPTAEVAPTPAAPAADDQAPSPDGDRLIASWPEVVAVLEDETPMVAALLAKAWPLKVEGMKFTIAFPLDAEFHCRKAQDERCREAIQGAFSHVLGVKPELAFELSGGDSPIEVPGEKVLSGDELAEALVRDFGAVETTEEAEGPGVAPQSSEPSGAA